MANLNVQYPAALVLKKVLKEKSNGELLVKGENFRKCLYFQEGMLIFAKTDVIEERLGETLFKIGKITRPQFNGILQIVKNKSESDKLGQILLERKMLNQRDLFFALLYQVRSIATSIFSISSGEWEFRTGHMDIPKDSRFNIELPGIITEGTNKLSNVGYFKNKFNFLAPKTVPIPEQMSEYLSTYEINFYKDLGGFVNQNCESINGQLKMTGDAFWKKLILLYLLNVLDFAEVEATKEIDKNVEEIINLYEQLKANSINYYELLNLKSDVVFNDIKTAYFSYAKKYHPDRISHAPDPEIKDKANFVFAEINKAYDTLSNAEKKRAYDSRGFKDENDEDTIKENLSERARMLYRKAKAYYAQKKFWEAASLLDEVVSLDSQKAAYFLLLGLCQVNIPSQKRMAEKNLQKAVDLEPWNVEAFTAMGMLFLSEGHSHRAEGFLRKALSLNPDHQLARKKLKEIQGHRSGEKKKGGFSLFGKSKK